MLMLRIMTWISLRLGRRVGRGVLHLIAAYFLVFASTSRVNSRRYLNRALGRRATWLDLYRHFHCFASTIHDRLYLLNQRFDLFDIRVRGQSLIDQALADGKGAFLVGAHMGSFEVIRALGRRHADAKVVMAMYEENARKISQMLAAINPKATQGVVRLGAIDSMLCIRDALDAGAMVGMLADRTLTQDATVPVNFLGSQALLATGPFRIAALMRRPVFFMTGLYLGGNRYEIVFKPLADFSACRTGQRQQLIEETVVRYASLLQQNCVKAPYNWFNFFDFWDEDSVASPQEEALALISKGGRP